ncbi:MAG: purine-binding chemotaxis protein CheW [Rhodocyclaceae bacterium]|nr:purine-binding chemotaxis protein CheW [Rhodocyclaceae bacterium]
MENAIVPVGPAAAESGQYLTFILGRETYSIGILAIKEIIEYGSVTAVPMMPAFVRGVINLRGAVVPVLDLLARFGMGRTEISRRSCIVIVEVRNGHEILDVGILVDAVNEVVAIPAADIEAAPSFGSRIDTRFIAGMGKVGGQFVVILNVERVADCADIAAGLPPSQLALAA